jgi:hypothetical protein
MQLSMWGYDERCECLRPREHARPKDTPRAMDTRKEKRKMPTPWKSEER